MKPIRVLTSHRLLFVTGVVGAVLGAASAALAGCASSGYQDPYRQGRTQSSAYGYEVDSYGRGYGHGSSSHYDSRQPQRYSDWERNRYDDDRDLDRRGRRIERHQQYEKRDHEDLQADEREELLRKQKQERKTLKSTGEWDKTDKRQQKRERKVLQQEQKVEDKDLQREQRGDWRDYWRRH